MAENNIPMQQIEALRQGTPPYTIGYYPKAPLYNLKLQHYRWLASKLLGAIYGDQKMVQVDQKIEIKWNTDDDLTHENEVKNVTNSGSTHETNKVSHVS